MTYINAENLTLYYPVFGSSSRSLKKTLVRAATGGRIAGDARGVTICALNKDVLNEWACFPVSRLFPETNGGTMFLKKNKTLTGNGYSRYYEKPRYVLPVILHGQLKNLCRQTKLFYGFVS